LRFDRGVVHIVLSQTSNSKGQQYS
jgi:hypothetical protein